MKGAQSWSKAQWWSAFTMTFAPPVVIGFGFGWWYALAFVAGMVWLGVLAFGTDA